MKYKCFIVDDEPLAVEVIRIHLSKLNQFEISGAFTDPIEAFMATKNENIDLLFLDIEMPDFNGLDFIKSLKTRPEIIITTAYREFAVEGFELNILDYLVKPIAFERFMMSIDKFLEIKESKETAQLTSEKEEFIIVRANRKLVKIDLDTILYIEGLKDYVKIVLDDDTILTKESIGNFFKRLNDEKFIRIHKSFIVSFDKISAVTSHDVEVGSKELPIGRNYKESVMQKFSKNY